MMFALFTLFQSSRWLFAGVRCNNYGLFAANSASVRRRSRLFAVFFRQKYSPQIVQIAQTQGWRELWQLMSAGGGSLTPIRWAGTGIIAELMSVLAEFL